MVGKNNQYLKTTKEGTRVESYSIKKFKVGTASVVIGASIFLGAGAVAQASEEVSNNTTNDNATNAGAKEEAPKAVEKAAKVENTKESVAAAVAAKVGAEAPKTEAKAEVNKGALKDAITELESNVKSAPDADQAAVSAAKEALAATKAVLANEAATQAEVDAQVQAVKALNTVVTEAQVNGVAAKNEAKKAEEKAKSEAKQTTEVKEAKKELTQVASEAEVTNKVAKTELSKKDLKVEAKPAVEKAVVKNEEALKVAKELLGNDNATKEQIAKSLEELSNSIKAVYAELENAGAKRNGKFDVVLADIADTVAEPPLSEDEQINHWKQYADKNTERLTKQIKWFDIANSKATVENLGAGDTLQVGTKFTQEISPGYVVTLTVTKLAPFNSTDEYKKRGGAGYDANAINEYKDGTPAELKVVTQGSYSVAKTNGMDTKGKTVIQSVKDGANVGVEFSVKSTLNGKEVPSNVVFLTGEEAGSSEVEIYKTDGDGFELVTELSNTTPRYSTARSYTAETYEYRTLPSAGHGQDGYRKQFGVEYTLNGSGKQAFEKFKADKAAGFFNTTVTSDTVIAMKAEDGKYHTDGLGTQVFGPVSTHRDSGFSTPLVMTRNAKNIGMYIFSAGQQGSMLGFMVLDEGDAPASYGRVAHSISRSDGQKQPYLGSVPADVDVRTTPINGASAFIYDDVNGIGAADEGARQLMGDDVAPNDNFKLKKVNDGTYSMTFDAHLDGEAKAYVNGWIDFNNNGKFDEGEAAGVTEVTQDGKVTLTWTNNYQIVDTTATKLATRLRIAYDKADVKAATGIAYSGEVEDFQIQQTIPPRGTKRETTDVQGATQTSTVAFNAYGQKNYDFDKQNEIDTTVKSQIVKPDGTLVTDADLVDGYYVVPGQGKYKIIDNGANVDVEFIPEANFVGTADGITIRRTDINGNTTGWGNEGREIIGGTGENKDQLDLVSEQVQLAGLAAKGSMDGRYIPTVTPKQIKGTPEESTDIQGKPQTKTPKFSIDLDKDGDGTAPDAVTPSAQYPAKLVDPATGQPTDEKTVTVPGEGSYTIDPTTGAVTFTPEPQFTGTAKGIDVSLTAPVGQDKNGQPVTATATAKYTPTVTPVKPTATPDTSTGVQGETQTGKPTFTEGNTEVPIKENSVKLLNPDGTEANGPVDALDPSGKKVGEYTVDPTTGVVTFTPTDKSYTGPVQPAKVQAEDKNGTKVSTTYTPTIVGVTPTATPATTEDVQGKTQESPVSFEGGKTTIAGKEKSVDIDPSTYTLLGEDGQPATEVPAKDPNGKVIGKYTLKTVDGKAVAVFEPTDKTYSGEVQPVKVQAKDKNGTAVETTYTPKITPVTPTAEPAETTDIQGKEQNGKPEFKPGNPDVPMDDKVPATFEDGSTEKVIPGEGTYTVAPDGTVTFTPEKNFTGKGTGVTVKRVDKNGTPVTAKYTPTVTPVTPTAEPKETTDIQGKEQTGKPEFKPGNPDVPMDDKVPATFEDGSTEKVIPGEGTYTVAPDGTVTFTPEKNFTGKGTGVTVKRVDKNGTPVTAKYTPTVTPVTPTAEPKETTDIQGKEQTGKPEFKPGNPDVPMDDKVPATFEDGSTEKVIPGEGTYTVAPDGTVTFTPEKTFTGKGTGVTVKRVDKNGTPVTAKYTPTVTPVTPTGTDAVTEEVQGKEQTGKPTFKPGNPDVPMDDEVPATFEDGSTEKVIPGEGTYTVAPDGTVTFTPEKGFTGKGTGVTVKRVDKNGTPVTAKYTPVVKPTVPTSTDVITTNVQGATQSGTPKFEGGKVTVNGEEKTVEIDETVKPTFEDGTTEKKVPGEGTYTIDENGKVTFTPEKTFKGQATGVTVKRVDKNGTPVTAKYTPVVVPVTPTSKDTESEGPKGQPQSGTPTFEGGKVTINGKEVPVEIDETVKPTFEDGSTEKKVPGEGTYTIDENGKVTFTPEPNFVGKAKGVTVKRVDKNGTPITAKYTPTVRPDTTYVDKDGNPLSPSEDGTKPTKDIPGYKVVKTEIDENGNTKHIYEKVTTTYKDKDGNVIPGTTTEEGTNPKKDIPGYRFVETKKLPNGDVEHVYEKVKTSHKDKDGNEIPNFPTEDGDQPKKDIPGYRFVETKKLP
ncbi:CshA/CshB family fibrillar adhesin-related protein, partial [Gemella haemolysans]|uniref:GEVED domain-containing protein n=1 Tax=Gemella haemolysans TaxID=1379 RepID=UPI00232FD0E5